MHQLYWAATHMAWSYPKVVRRAQAAGIMDELVRVALGVEATDDMLNDFAQALMAVRRATANPSSDSEPCRTGRALNGGRAWPPGKPLPPAHGVMESNADGAPLAGTGVPLPPGVPPPGAAGPDPPPGAALVGGSVLGCLLSEHQGGVTIQQTRTPE